MLKNNYHTHMKYCNHAEGETVDYVKKAIELGFSELGMSDHAPIPLNHGMTKAEWDENYCYENMTLDIFDRYLAEIDELRIKYPNIKILKGLESEFLDNNLEWYTNLRKRLDYMILGIHFYNYDGRVLDTYRDINDQTVDGYLRCARLGIESGLFNYLAHPDLYLYNYEFNDKAKMVCQELIDLCVRYDIYFEINTNGLKYTDNKLDQMRWRYPNKKFWLYVKDYMDKNPGKLKVIVGADSHTPDALNNDNVQLVEEFIKEIGLEVVEKAVF